MRKILVVVVSTVTAVSLALVWGTAAMAANGDVYCFGDTTVTTPFVAPNGFDMSDASMLYDLAQGDYAWINMEPPPGQTVYSATSDPAKRPSPPFQKISIASGACPVGSTWVAPEARVAVCKMLPRGDGTTGMFQNITVAQWNDKDGQYFDAPAANWVEGMGLTCDNPLALGYKSAGYGVAWGGMPDPGQDPNGVRASGLNNIYPYFTK